jgi:biotin carboxylase
MNHAGQRLLLLASKTGYQTRAFAEAARRLGVELVYATDRCHVLEDPWGDRALPLRFEDPDYSAQQIVDFARRNRLEGIVSLGDRPTPTAARAAAELRLSFHSPNAADVCANKYLSRERLSETGFDIPRFVRFAVDCDFAALVKRDANFPIPFPCVLKPLALSGSRGVIRANTPAEAIAAFERIRTMLRSPDVQVLREEALGFIQAEEYVDGEEVAVEGLMQNGRLHVLAIFDKPVPLTGPYFEETIYVTPSRLPQLAQQSITQTLERAIAALGLRHGPVHAELRLPSDGRIVILEIAARCIGGLCARALRFIGEAGEICGLEELIIRNALDEPTAGYVREPLASAVMMVPIPQGGIYQSVSGTEAALATPYIEEVHITAKQGQKLVPLPEGSSYLGFLFARAASPQQVVDALNAAHANLSFTIAPALPLVSMH